MACNGLAANAFVVTHIASATAALSWLFFEWAHRGKPTTLGAASGAVAGLVAITPASGYVGPLSAIVIGGLAGVICYGGVLMKSRLGYDDSLDVVGIHGLGGTWGALATGLFASTTVNPGAANGLFFGNAGQLWTQLVSVVVTRRLCLRHDPDHPQGHRLDHGSARNRGRRRKGYRHQSSQ